MADLQPDKGAVVRDANGDIVPDEGAEVKPLPDVIYFEPGGGREHNPPPGYATVIDDRYRYVKKGGPNPGMSGEQGLTHEDPISYVLGGGVGKKVGSAVATGIADRLGTAAAEKVTPVAVNALSAFGKRATNAELAKQVIAGAGKKLATMVLGEQGAGAAGQIAERVGGAAANAASAAAPKIAGAASGVATAAVPRAFGALSNNIERLRNSAAGNPRAAELLAKITEYQPNFETVTQSNGVQP